MTALKTLLGFAVFLGLYALAGWLPTVMPNWLQWTIALAFLASIPAALYVLIMKWGQSRG